ncbi:MAG: ParB N-terminal domain-containing protein [Phycisphaeraceae bacterium]
MALQEIGALDQMQAPDSTELGLEPISTASLDQIKPSPENDRLYKPVDPEDPDIRALADSIIEHGICEPIVITLDGFILSGHRRYAAARRAGLGDVPVRRVNIWRQDDVDRFVRLLREYNRQREKSIDEKVREELVSADPVEAYQCLLNHRRELADVELPEIQLRERTKRARITNAKRPMLEAIKRIVNESRKNWPLSDRRIHYALLNDPPLKHASKPDHIYTNDHTSYKALVELLTRARLAGEIPMRAISDDTRPVTAWKVYDGPGAFVRDEVDGFLNGYFRNLMRSQPAHIELLAEKNTVYPIVRRVANDYCIPVTSGRGFASLPPRAAMARRFRRSGKDRLIILIVSDFDPDGEEIAHSFARSMRDDFGIESTTGIKAALTAEQVAERDLPLHLEAKKGSPNYRRFTETHGTQVAELEALPSDELEQIVRDVVDSVVDHDALEREREAEAEDAAYLAAVRNQVSDSLQELDWGDHGE